MYLEVSQKWHSLLAVCNHQTSEPLEHIFQEQSPYHISTDTVTHEKRSRAEDEREFVAAQPRKLRCTSTTSNVRQDTYDTSQRVTGVRSEAIDFQQGPSPTHPKIASAATRRTILPSTPLLSVTEATKSGFGVLSLESHTYRDATDCLHYNPRFRVLICKEHGYAVASWKRHLSDYHTFDKIELKQAANVLHKLEVIKPEYVLLPLPNEPAIQFLQQSRTGYKCQGSGSGNCDFISVSRGVVAEHCNVVHS